MFSDSFASNVWAVFISMATSIGSVLSPVFEENTMLLLPLLDVGLLCFMTYIILSISCRSGSKMIFLPSFFFRVLIRLNIHIVAHRPNPATYQRKRFMTSYGLSIHKIYMFTAHIT